MNGYATYCANRCAAAEGMWIFVENSIDFFYEMKMAKIFFCVLEMTATVSSAMGIEKAPSSAVRVMGRRLSCATVTAMRNVCCVLEMEIGDLCWMENEDL